jgi:hypothetical protein
LRRAVPRYVSPSGSSAEKTPLSQIVLRLSDQDARLHFSCNYATL